MYGILSILTVTFHAITSVLGFLYIYLHRQIRPIQKHPGNLIYHQILILSLFSTSQAIYNSVKYLAFTFGLGNQDIAIYSRIQVVLDFYCLVNLISYQLFIGIEVFVKSLFSRIRKWYITRVKLYHYLSHIIPLVSCAIFAEDFLKNTDYARYILHATIPSVLIVISLMFLYGIQCSLENQVNSPRKRYCNEMLCYLNIVLYIKIVEILSCFIKLAYDHQPEPKENPILTIGIYGVYYLLDWTADFLIVYSRMLPTHTYTYFKDILKRSRTKNIRTSSYKQHTEIFDTSSIESNSIGNDKVIKRITDAHNKTVRFT